MNKVFIVQQFQLFFMESNKKLNKIFLQFKIIRRRNKNINRTIIFVIYIFISYILLKMLMNFTLISLH